MLMLVVELMLVLAARIAPTIGIPIEADAPIVSPQPSETIEVGSAPTARVDVTKAELTIDSDGVVTACRMLDGTSGDADDAPCSITPVGSHYPVRYLSHGKSVGASVRIDNVTVTVFEPE